MRMKRRSQSITMIPPSADLVAVYERRGMMPPTLTGRSDPAALWPYEPRWLHESHARANGYFWMPCILCQRHYGGHEIGDSIPDPIEGEGRGMSICPVCTAERNGGTP